jgi:hypothetical protein
VTVHRYIPLPQYGDRWEYGWPGKMEGSLLDFGEPRRWVGVRPLPTHCTRGAHALHTHCARAAHALRAH